MTSSGTRIVDGDDSQWGSHPRHHQRRHNHHRHWQQRQQSQSRPVASTRSLVSLRRPLKGRERETAPLPPPFSLILLASSGPHVLLHDTQGEVWDRAECFRVASS
ncbi:hypothetical protein LY76DRAFT_279291 [Colletotrichum caudatum]|nr:hypothetical protein LY76DRAFT_279291 [Colletotrichum caudatum]